MDFKKRKRIFNIAGGAVIVLWAVLIGLLVRKTAFRGNSEPVGTIQEGSGSVLSSQREWMEIFLKGKKVGYSVNTVTRLADNYLIQEDIFIRLSLLGQPNGIHTVTQSIVDHTFSLKNFRFKMISGMVSFQVTGKVEGSLMRLEFGGSPGKRSQVIRLSRPPVIGSALSYYFKGRNLAVGESFRFPIFDPSTMAQKEMRIKVVGREDVTIARVKHPAFRLETRMWGQPMTFWLDEKGTVLKEKGFMGFTLIKSSAANAPRNIEGGESDFYEMAAISVDKPLPRAKELTYLKLRIKGLQETGFDTTVLNTGRQRLNEGTVEIRRERVPAMPSYKLPFKDEMGAMGVYLRPEVNIESDDPAIVHKAQEIAGDAKDPVLVAKRLTAWVYSKLEKKPLVMVPSAAEVLKTRVGDCNEHAVLLTALLRAAGIPARVCVGIVYARNKFYYHAWTECFLGNWVSVDATINQVPADATHIKLVEGGLDKQVEIVRLMGRIALEVLDYKY